MPDFTAEVIAHTKDEDGTDKFTVSIKTKHTIPAYTDEDGNKHDARDEDAFYNRIVTASSPEELEAAITDEVNIIKANLDSADHPAVGQVFDF